MKQLFCSRSLALVAALILCMGHLSFVQSQNTQLAVTQAALVATTAASGANALYVRRAVADGQGNIYLTGIFTGTVAFGGHSLTSAGSSYELFVAKRNAVGTYQWAARGGGLGGIQVWDMAVDAAGNAVVTGYFGERTASFGNITLTNAALPTASLSNDVFVAKLNGSSQTWQWALSAGGSTRVNGDDQGRAVAVDGQGNVYVAGTFNSSVAFFGGLQVANPYPGFNNIFMGKLTPAGTWVWVKGQEYMGNGPSGLSVDADQHIYLTGVYGRGQAKFGSFILTSWILEAFVAKVDGTGAWQWATGTGTEKVSRSYNTSRSVSMSAAMPDGARGLYVAGVFGFGSTYVDTLVVGNAVLINNGAISPPGPSGQTSRTADAFVARLNARTGAWQWAVQTTGAGSEGFGRPLVDNAKRVYVSGGFGEPKFPYSPSNGGNTFGPFGLQSAGGDDVVVAQLDSTGRWLWARQTGGSNSEYATLCSVDAQGRGVLAGYFEGATGQIGPFALPMFNPAQSATYFMAVLGTNGPLASEQPSTKRGFDVFPNPARTEFTITGLLPGQVIQLLDALGRTVLTGSVPARGNLQLKLPSGLPTGLYLVRAGVQTQRLVVE